MNKHLVALLSPAGYLTDNQVVVQAQNLLQNWGFKSYVAPHALQQHGHFAGTDAQRLSDLQQALDNPEVDIIWALRGGYGSVRIVDRLDFTAFKKHPKLLVGFSDITILHNRLHQLGFPSLHALMPVQLLQNPSDEVLLQTYNAMSGKAFGYEFDRNEHNRNEQAFSGTLVGGNLANLYSLLGTPLDIDTSNKILFIEDVGEALYNIDRMMIALQKAGKLASIKALIVGQFTSIPDNDPAFGKTYQEIILEHTVSYNFPIIFNAPVGHITNNYPLMLGAELQVEIKDNKVDFQQFNK